MTQLASRELPFLFLSKLNPPPATTRALAPKQVNRALPPFRRVAFTARKKRDLRTSWTWGRVAGEWQGMSGAKPTPHFRVESPFTCVSGAPCKSDLQAIVMGQKGN